MRPRPSPLLRPPGLTRRGLLKAGAAGLAAAGLAPRPARATPAKGDLKFVFIYNYGGWDPLFVFAPMFGRERIEMEADAAVSTFGNIPIVDHPDRPSVRSYFEAYHARTLVVNGIMMPTIAHVPGERAILTGATYDRPFGDWATQLSVPVADRYILPTVVLSGPSFAGEHAEVVCRVGARGQLDSLLSGEWSRLLDVPVAPPAASAQTAVGDWLYARGERFAARATSAQEDKIAAAWNSSLDRTNALKASREVVAWGNTTTFEGEIDRTIEILSAGLSRCVTMWFSTIPWDTHTENDAYQSVDFQDLFTGINQLMEGLDNTPGTSAPTLAEETVVVVLSEMGRTPLHNAAAGRDHWPYTTAMLIGPGVTGDRVVGAFDDYFNGVAVDLASGELSDSGSFISAPTLGATILALGDVDSGEALPDTAPIDGVLT